MNGHGIIRKVRKSSARADQLPPNPSPQPPFLPLLRCLFLLAGFFHLCLKAVHGGLELLRIANTGREDGTRVEVCHASEIVKIGWDWGASRLAGEGNRFGKLHGIHTATR